MKTLVLVVAGLLLLPVLAAWGAELSTAQQILDRYLKAPWVADPATTDAHDSEVVKQATKARLARLSMLAELKAVPQGAVPTAERVLFEQASPEQRSEIVSVLGGSVRTRECAELLHRVLQDVREPKDKKAAVYEELVRRSAVHGLRTMARRTDRTGGKRVQRKPDFDPLVSGLVPYLVSAAHDRAEGVRVNALYALADSRDPAAVPELRNRLADESERVRLYAACFLTEYHDASGLLAMRKALDRLRGMSADARREEPDYYAQVEMLLASFERISGKSFGEIPLNPDLSSSTSGREARRCEQLLGIWQAWWNWLPDAAPDGNP